MDKMPSEIYGFTQVEYLTVFNAMIFGYVGAEYFVGWGNLLRNREKIKVYWQHLLWTFFAFLLFFQNWYGVWPRISYINVNIFYFLYSLVPIFIFHLISVILFPSFENPENKDMETYFYKNSRWLFSLFAVYFAMTICSSFVYEDKGNVVAQNALRGFGVVLSVTASWFSKNKKLHYAFLVIGFVALGFFIKALPH